ncbi:MAG: TldD/PmbA family protein [Ruminococcaceae bacterium]|nr:TldD/PmbA family protein [Oscillospiraceae bacterium]
MKFDAVKDRLIAEAEQAGIAEYEVYFMESTGVNAETLKDEISSFSSGVGGGVCFRCIVDGHMGSASTELLTEEEMRALVRRAVDHARYIESDEKAILFAGSERYATPSVPVASSADAAELKALALSLQRKVYAASPYVADGTQTAAFAEEIRMELLNSHGLRLSGQGTVKGVYVQAVVQKDGESSDAFDFTLESEGAALDALPVSTVAEALSKLDAKEIESGKYDVIISGKEMRSLLSAFSSVFSAKNAQMGLSLLKGKEGEPIAAEGVTLVDDPMREGCPMQTAFDGEGVATYRKNVIENGVLKTLLYDLATADKAGVATTANGQRLSYAEPVSIRPYSFYLAAGMIGEEELKQRLGNGLYITEFKGLHAGCNAVTGDFSIESAGYVVRNGKCCEAVKSFTVAGNFFDLLREVEALSECVKFGIPSGFTCFGSPDVLLRNMSIAGK